MTKRKIIYFSALIIFASMTLISCIETDKTVGTGLIPSDQDIQINIKEFDIPVQMRASDSLQTIFSGSIVIGDYKDSDFGTMKAGSAFQFIPSQKGLTFGENPVAKSFRINIIVSNKSFFYEKDEFIPQNFNVYELTKDLDSTTAYNNSITEEHFSKNPIQTSGNVYFGTDSLVMNLSLDYANKILSLSKEKTDSLELYLKEIKGLYIETDPLPGSIMGGRINIIDPSNIFFILTYRHIDTEKSIDKDSTLVFNVSSELPNVNRFTHGSSHLQEELPSDKIFVEGLAGIKPYVDFNLVKNQISSWMSEKSISKERFIIAKAELRLPFEYPEDFTRLTYYPSQLFLASRNRTEGSSLIFYEPIDDLRFVETNGAINRSLKYYSLDISSYIQSLIKDNLTANKKEIFITPILQKTDYYSGTTYYFIQNILYSKAILNGNSSQRKPKLVITYATLPN